MAVHPVCTPYPHSTDGVAVAPFSCAAASKPFEENLSGDVLSALIYISIATSASPPLSQSSSSVPSFELRSHSGQTRRLRLSRLLLTVTTHPLALLFRPAPKSASLSPVRWGFSHLRCQSRFFSSTTSSSPPSSSPFALTLLLISSLPRPFGVCGRSLPAPGAGLLSEDFEFEIDLQFSTPPLGPVLCPQSRWYFRCLRHRVDLRYWSFECLSANCHTCTCQFSPARVIPLASSLHVLCSTP